MATKATSAESCQKLTKCRACRESSTFAVVSVFLGLVPSPEEVTVGEKIAGTVVAVVLCQRTSRLERSGFGCAVAATAAAAADTFTAAACRTARADQILCRHFLSALLLARLNSPVGSAFGHRGVPSEV